MLDAAGQTVGKLMITIKQIDATNASIHVVGYRDIFNINIKNLQVGCNLILKTA